MALTIAEENLPASFWVEQMSDEAFIELCAQYPDYFIEMTSDGEVIVMPPNFFWTAMVSGEIVAQLRNWAVTDGRGVAMDASGGFVLPNGARRAPDAAWISRRQLDVIGAAKVQRWWRACPEFVVEVRSPYDRTRTIRAKMLEWIENGAQLAWLLDPKTRSIEIFTPHGEPQTITEATTISAQSPIEGFVLDLARVWNPIA